MAQYVISYRKTENGVQYYATPETSPGENYLTGYAFGSPQDAEVIAMSLNQQQATPESAYNLVPGLAQDRKAPILTPDPGATGGGNAPVSGTPPLTDAEAIAQGEAEIAAAEQKRRDDLSSVAFATTTPGTSDYMDQAQFTGWQTRNQDPTMFGDTPGMRVENEWRADRGMGGSGGVPTSTGAPVGTSPTDWGLFEQDLMAGQVDPRRAVSEQLSRQGLPTHANRGFLEDTYANYGTLRQMQSPGLTPEPVDMFNEATGFTNDLFGMTGNSMNRVDTQGLWDNQFSQEYQDTMGAEYNAVSANGGQAGEQHQYEFEDINNNIAALAPHIGEQNAGYLMTLTQQAYDEYINDPVRNQMTFAQYLRDVKGAGDWY
jgi:hypothetical protein